MEGSWRPQQGHSAVHVLQLLWRKSIFPWREFSSNQFLPAAGFGPHRWLPHFGMLASYASSNKDMMLDGYLHPKCVYVVCVCVCVRSELRGRESKREREEGKGSRRRWKRMSFERKAREHKGTRARSSILQAPKRKCRGREKEGRGKLELQTPLPSTHTDSSTQTLLMCFHYV